MGKVFKFNEFVNESYNMNEHTHTSEEVLLAYTNAKDDGLSDAEAKIQVTEILGITKEEVELALDGGETFESVHDDGIVKDIKKVKAGDKAYDIDKAEYTVLSVDVPNNKITIKHNGTAEEFTVDYHGDTEDTAYVYEAEEVPAEGETPKEATVDEVGKYNVIETELRPIMADLKKVEGLVMLGAGGDIKDWIEGVTTALHKEKIISTENPNDVFTTFYKTVTTGGRTDLIMVFNPSFKIDIGKLAMWRIRFGDCSWISDFIVNYASHYGLESREETAKNTDHENNEY